MYAHAKAISTAQPRVKQNLHTPTTNSPTHISVPHTPEERFPGPSSSASVSMTRSDPTSEPKYPPRGEFSFSDESFVPLVEDQNLDDLWDTLRQKKETRMSKEKSKVKSLEQPSIGGPLANGESTSHPPQPRTPSQPRSRATAQTQREQPTRSIKRVKSLTQLRISDDGKNVVAFFDMTDVLKENVNVHVSFKPPRLVVSWFIETITEFEDEQGRFIIDRLQKDYQRTLPLPEGTKFQEIRGTMNGHHLVVSLPNCRSFRVERVFDEADDIDG